MIVEDPIYFFFLLYFRLKFRIIGSEDHVKKKIKIFCKLPKNNPV